MNALNARQQLGVDVHRPVALDQDPPPTISETAAASARARRTKPPADPWATFREHHDDPRAYLQAALGPEILRSGGRQRNAGIWPQVVYEALDAYCDRQNRPIRDVLLALATAHLLAEGALDLDVGR